MKKTEAQAKAREILELLYSDEFFDREEFDEVVNRSIALLDAAHPGMVSMENVGNYSNSSVENVSDDEIQEFAREAAKAELPMFHYNSFLLGFRKAESLK